MGITEHYSSMNTPKEITNIISFSGGQSSALMTLIVKNEPDHTDSEVIFCNTGLEHPSTLDFVNSFSKHFKIPITWLEYRSGQPNFELTSFCKASRHGEPFIQLCLDLNYLPNRAIRACTQELKVRTIKRYLKTKGIQNYAAYIGIRYDEPSRWAKLINNQNKDVFTYEFPLYDMQIDKPTVNLFWQKMPFKLNIPSFLGNCTLCFNKGKGNLIRALQSKEANYDIWNQLEILFGKKFSNRYSLKELNTLANLQTSLFPFDFQDVDCHCNID